MSAYRPYFTVARPYGEWTVYCSIEYPRHDPPSSILIDGIEYRRVDWKCAGKSSTMREYSQGR